MNSVVSFLIGLTVGASSAAVITYKVVDKKSFDKYSEKLDNEIADVQAYYERKIGEISVEMGAIKPKNEDSNAPKEKNTPKTAQKRVDYTSFYDQNEDKNEDWKRVVNDDSEEREELEDDGIYEPTPEEADIEMLGDAGEVDPFLITNEAFHNPNDSNYKQDYKHVTFDYYVEDDILSNPDTNKIVKNRYDLLGRLWENNFGNSKYCLDGDMDSVYLRVPHVNTDFEIISIGSSYRESVLDMNIGDILSTGDLLLNSEDFVNDDE